MAKRKCFFATAGGRLFNLVAGAVLVGYPGDEYTCTHEHHRGGDECLSFQLEPELVDDVGLDEAGMFFALRASDRAAVDRFYQAALKAGGRDNGAPGPRPDYSPTHYAAFVIDPDGNNVEAVMP